MAEIGTATIEITPVIPEDLQAQVEAQIREAVADALRRLADSLTERTGANPTPTAADEPRYYVEQINGLWGVRDRKMPDEWASWGDEDDLGKDDAEISADHLNQGHEPRDYVAWTALGTPARLGTPAI